MCCVVEAEGKWLQEAAASQACLPEEALTGSQWRGEKRPAGAWVCAKSSSGGRNSHRSGQSIKLKSRSRKVFVVLLVGNLTDFTFTVKACNLGEAALTSESDNPDLDSRGTSLVLSPLDGVRWISCLEPDRKALAGRSSLPLAAFCGCTLQDGTVLGITDGPAFGETGGQAQCSVLLISLTSVSLEGSFSRTL